MKGDFSRFSFDRKKRYSAVLSQQGRLQLDSDWNEQAQIAERRNASLTRDLVGRSAMPEGKRMELKVVGGTLTLASGGVYYVDGLMIENENTGSVKLGSPKNADGQPVGGNFLYYLDAWAREVDAIEDENLIDPALGLETAVRLKTEWCIRYRRLGDETPSNKATYLKGHWPEPTEDWERRLSTGTLLIAPDTADSKTLKVKTRDSRLYRIEVHQDDELSAKPFFKWARNNASICAEVVIVEGFFELKNDSEEARNAFKNAKWIEMSIPGQMNSDGSRLRLMIDMTKKGNDFDKGVFRIADTHEWMDQAVFGETLEDPKQMRKLRIRRWDGVFSLDDEDVKEALKEELGITLGCSTGFYRDGDYWSILVRDGEVENWEAGVAKPAEGVEHHFVALGFVGFSEQGAVETLEPLGVLFEPLTSRNLYTTHDTTVGGDLDVAGIVTAGDGYFRKPASATELLFFALTPRRLDFDSGFADAEKTIALFSKANWTASSDATWCAVTPNGGASGNATVTVRVTEENNSGETRTATLTFETTDFAQSRAVTVTQPVHLAPRIDGFMPSEASHGKALAIFGSNFHPTPSRNVVRLNGVEAVVEAVTATQLTVTVPKNMGCSGNITVTVGSKTGTSVDRFNYVLPAVEVTWFAGNREGYLDGDVRFYQPRGITQDSEGNLYVLDVGANEIHKVTPQGEVSTIVSWNIPIPSLDDSEREGFGGFGGITIDDDDNLYVTSTSQPRIWKITPQGTVSAIAGGESGFADGVGAAAQFISPLDITIYDDDNLYVADSDNYCIRKITWDQQKQDWEVSTIAGNPENRGFANGKGTNAQFSYPWGIAIDKKHGDLYVTDVGNPDWMDKGSRIRKITPEGEVSTLAGSEQEGEGLADGTGADARFGHPRGIAIDGDGNLYVMDSYGDIETRIRVVTPQGVVGTLAGGAYGFVDGPGTIARFGYLSGVVVDASGDLYVTEEWNQCIRKIEFEKDRDPSAPQIDGFLPFEALHSSALTIYGSNFDPLPINNVVRLNKVQAVVETATPTQLSVAVPENLNCNGKIRVTADDKTDISTGWFDYLLPAVKVSTFADIIEGSLTGITIDDKDNLYVLDYSNNRILKVTQEGKDSTVASINTDAPDYVHESDSFEVHFGIAIDTEGNLYLLDEANNRIRKVTPKGVFSTFAGGNPDSGSADGEGTDAQFYRLHGITIDDDGNLYVADASNNLIRMVTPQGVVSTLAGSGTEGYADSIIGADAQFCQPQGITIDASKNLYVADTQNHCIRKVTPQGEVSTLAGIGTVNGIHSAGFTDGTGKAARFNIPIGITIDDASGNLYVADKGNHCIRKVTQEGVVSTIAGNGATAFSDGTGTVAQFDEPYDITIDSFGNLYVIELYGNRIRKIEIDDYSPPRIDSFDPPEAPHRSALTISGSNFDLEPTNNVVRFNGVQAVVTAATATQLTVTVPQDANCSGHITVRIGNMIAASADRFSYGSPPLRINSFTPSEAPHGSELTISGTSFDPTLATNNVVRLNGVQAEVTAATATQLTVTVPKDANCSGYITVTVDGVTATSADRFKYVLPAVEVSWFAGNRDGYLDGDIRFYQPGGITQDSEGNLYVLDVGANEIHKVTPQGVVSTIVSWDIPIPSIDDSEREDFGGFGGITIDADDNLYVTSTSQPRIWKMTPQGTVSAIAGGESGFADGVGAAAQFANPQDIAIDTSGNLYVVDLDNHCIRKITPEGMVSTLAGSTAGPNAEGGYADGEGTDAQFNVPHGIVVDTSGNLYVTDSGNHCIRKITPEGVVSTLAGSSGPEGRGYADGTGADARFGHLRGIDIDASGNLYVMDNLDDSETRIRLVTLQGVVGTLAGGESGFVDGPGTVARFSGLSDVVVDASGDLYVTEEQNACIRKIEFEKDRDPSAPHIDGFTPSEAPHGSTLTISGINFDPTPANNVVRFNGVEAVVTAATATQLTVTVPKDANCSGYITVTVDGKTATSAGRFEYVPTVVVSTLAGSGVAGFVDGIGTVAQFDFPYGIVIDASGNAYVADYNNHCIRKVTSDGEVGTIAGNGTAGFADGTEMVARFRNPIGITTDASDNLYVADFNNHSIRKVASDGEVSTIAGNGTAGLTDGAGTNAQFRNPFDITTDVSGNLYVADFNNHSIRKVASDGEVSTIAGNGTAGFADGMGTNAQFNQPNGIVMDASGNLYVADYNNHRIRKVTPQGEVSTIAGDSAGLVDGAGTAARFRNPAGITIDASGNLYVVDRSNSCIRKVTPQGEVSTIAGDGTRGFADGVGTAAQFDYPYCISIDDSGNLYVGDRNNHSIRKIEIE